MNGPVSEGQPLRTLFLATSMPVGGAETLLANLTQRMNRDQFTPEIACLKELGELGEAVSEKVTTSSGYLRHKFDLRVLPKLIRYMRCSKTVAVITVGAGDKMFWGRLASRFVRAPVVISALHSTGWPDGVGRLNRWLTPITDAFVAVAEDHGRFLRQLAWIPDHKVRVIPNGIDTTRFQRDFAAGNAIRAELGIPKDVPVCGMVAALRPEKNHDLFLRAAKQVQLALPDAQFLIIGDGPERGRLEQLSIALELNPCVRFLGCRHDIPAVLSALNAFVLSSTMEANPVSILEALATEVPVVATEVGSVPSTVLHGKTGYLVSPNDVGDLADRITLLLTDHEHAALLGARGRQRVASDWSVDAMVRGYEDLILEIYRSKLAPKRSPATGPESTQQAGHQSDHVVSV